MNTEFWSGKLKEGDHSEDVGTDGKLILEWISRKLCGKMWTGCIWLRKRTNGGLL
jgi:hypothetical protein